MAKKTWKAIILWSLSKEPQWFHVHILCRKYIITGEIIQGGQLAGSEKVNWEHSLRRKSDKFWATMILYGFTTSWLIGMSLWSSFLILINKSWTNRVFVIELIEEENSMDLIAFLHFLKCKEQTPSWNKDFILFEFESA